MQKYKSFLNYNYIVKIKRRFGELLRRFNLLISLIIFLKRRLIYVSLLLSVTKRLFAFQLCGGIYLKYAVCCYFVAFIQSAKHNIRTVYRRT